MPNPTFAKEDSAAGTLDLRDPSSHSFTHYGYVDFRIDRDLTPSITRFTLIIYLCIQY